MGRDSMSVLCLGAQLMPIMQMCCCMPVGAVESSYALHRDPVSIAI